MAPRRFEYDLDEDVQALIQHSGVNVNAFRGKKILITGGTGFFGIWFLSALSKIQKVLEGNLHVYVVTRSVKNFLTSSKRMGLTLDLEFIQGDIREVQLGSKCITHLVHMATTNASETFAGEDQLNKLKVLYEGTENILSQCTASLESVLFTSSGVTYGPCNTEKITEKTPNAPDSTDLGSGLALGKLVAEYLVAYYATKLGYKYSIARCFSFAGQYLPLDLHYAFGNFVQNALDGQDVLIQGDGADKRSYLYIGDALAWLLKMLTEPKNQVLNVGSERAITVKDLADLIAENSGLKVQLIGKDRDVGNFRRPSYVPDTTKIRQFYPGLDEWTSIHEIARKMLITKK